jgi:hypothetical protein
MESQTSSISAWSRGAMRNETLMVREAKQRNEPFVLWPREARPVYISELAEMDVTRLRQLASDISINISEVNINLNLLFTELKNCPENTPAAKQKIKLAIRKLTSKKSKIKLLRAEAQRTINALIQNPKKPAESGRFLKIREAEKQMSHLKLAKFFEIVRERLGDDVFNGIQLEALENIIQPFIEWAKSEGVPDDTTNHVIDHNLNAYRSKL